MSKAKITESLDERSQGADLTASPSSNEKWALDVIDRSSVQEIGTDAVDAFSLNTNEITAASHAAIQGDRIRFTSGVLNTREFTVYKVATNTIQLGEEVGSTGPSAADTFAILRPISLVLSSTGGFSTVNTFVRNGSNQAVTEDTSTPANNRPLPVKLTGVTGDITITADQLDINLDHANDSVEARQTTHDNLNANANLQVGDADVANGNPVPISDAGGSLTVDNTNLDAALSTLATQTTAATIAGDTTSIDGKTPSLGQATMASSVPVAIASNQSAVPISAASLPLPTGAATEASLSSIDGKMTSHDLDSGAGTENNQGVSLRLSASGGSVEAGTATNPLRTDPTGTTTQPVSASSLPLPTGASTSALQTTGNTSLSTIAGAVSGTEMQVDIVAPLPAGTNNIGDVDVVSSALPTGAATSALQTTGNSSLSTIAGAVSGSEMQVDVVASLPAGSNTIGAVDVNGLDVFDVEYIDFSSSNLPGNATNPLQVVASLSQAVKAIQVFDTGGVPIELMTGAAASEVRKFLIGPGSDQTVEVAIAASTRVSIRRVDDSSALAVGDISINFLG